MDISIFQIKINLGKILLSPLKMVRLNIPQILKTLKHLKEKHGDRQPVTNGKKYDEIIGATGRKRNTICQN